MFSYNIENKKLYITIPSEIEYNFNFLNSVTGMVRKIENSNCDKIYILYSGENIDFNKMGIAHLYNTLIFLDRKKKVYVSTGLGKMIHKQVAHSTGEKFKKISFEDSMKDVQQCYCFKRDQEVKQTVQILVEFIKDKSLIFESAKEFLVTTLGEIFSNAFNHSDEDQVFFMYDIELRNEDFFLVINVTDYGKTIIRNVQEYQESISGELLGGKDCIEWAMKSGHTTREGSGGYGLPTLVDYVSKANGELLIFSGDCIYALKGTTEKILEAKGTFAGTSVSMKIPLFDRSKMIMYDRKNKELISIDLDKI